MLALREEGWRLCAVRARGLLRGVPSVRILLNIGGREVHTISTIFNAELDI